MTADTMRDLLISLEHAVGDDADEVEDQLADGLAVVDNPTLAAILQHPRVSTRRLYDGAMRAAVARILLSLPPTES